MSPTLERRLLQAAIALAGIVPVTAGLAGVIAGPVLLDTPSCDASCDSHVRYLSGLLLGIGLTAWSMVPRIEQAAPVFRTLTALVAIGGLARLSGLALIGAPGLAMCAALVMELLVTPALCLWQNRVINRLERARRV